MGAEPREEMGGWEVDDFRAQPRKRQRPPAIEPPRPSRPWAWVVAMLALGALGAGLFVLRQPLSDMLWPETRAQQLQADAAQALAEGRLTSPDGRGARELYAAALARDPDRAEAREGLAKVGEAALARADKAMAARQYKQAHSLIALARDLAVPRAKVDALEKRLRAREADEAGIDTLLAQAAAARLAGQLDGNDHAALPLYQRVLALQPSRVEALEGREDTLADLLQLARTSLSRGELADASSRIRRVQAADPGHVDLPDALAQLARAGEAHRNRADEALRRGRLDEALNGYLAALAAMPDDAAAERGLMQIANTYAQRSERYAADFRFDDAEAALRDARAIALDAPGIAQAQQRLLQARQTQQRHGRREPSAERTRRIDQLLVDATQAEARGDLLTPPGDSAYDKLRAAQALAPQDPRVRGAMARLLPAAQQCFEDELRGNRLRRARECLDARAALEGESAALRDARRRLAQRWIAVGDERLGAGELGAAQAALTAARELDPQAIGLGEFADRLRAASAAN
ncbi:hypothetical protein P8609_10705 [Lysobacter sp. UC]|uniref:Tetratricopeptide repeat protein n=2 Tax=Lysobacter arvi TaxID=3038776 RepID=A0ABU1CE47_9GAMM|nr:hypothetical protein [Lysobacter arvi]MDR0183431.1 hypothetical protein [Lysobacter arvi]